MKSIAAAALILALLNWSNALAGGDKSRSYVLSPKDDKFHAQFGGRVFQVYCGNRIVYVFKKADGRNGYFSCNGNQTSGNAFIVKRRKSKWKRAK